MQRGQIYRVPRPPGDPKQYRAFVVVSRQVLVDSQFPTVICAPIYTNGYGLSTQVSVGAEEGMKHHSWILCDNLISMAKTSLTQYVGSLSSTKLAEVDRALAMALDLRS